MRLFVSVVLPGYVIKTVNTIQNLLQKQDALFEGRFVSLEHLHLTLKFIGDVPEDVLADIKQALHSVQQQPFDVCMQRVTLEPPSRNAHLIWIDIDSAPLKKLAMNIEEALLPWAKPESRPFASHITLVRIKKVHDIVALQNIIDQISISDVCFPIDRFYLQASTASAEGPVYSTLETFQLLTVPS